MILSTHAVVGSSISHAFSLNPVGSFAVGFISHFVLDAIPHWDYPTYFFNGTKGKTISKCKIFIIDGIKIILDIAGGTVIPTILFYQGDGNFAFICGALGGMAPDFFHILYRLFPHKLISKINDFHHFCHTRIKLKDWHIAGPALQILFSTACVFLSMYIYKSLL